MTVQLTPFDDSGDAAFEALMEAEQDEREQAILDALGEALK